MTKKELRKTIDSLSPTEEQKLRMLKNIKKRPKRNYFKFISLAAAVLILAIGVKVAMDQNMFRNHSEIPQASAPDKSEDSKEKVESSAKQPHSEAAMAEIVESPWTQDMTPKEMPIVSLDSQTSQEVLAFDWIHPQTYEEKIVHSILSNKEEYQYRLNEFSIVKLVPIISYEEALLILKKEKPEVDEGSVKAELSYSQNKTTKELEPVYDFFQDNNLIFSVPAAK